MENESCSWVTRAKFSQKTFIRSGSSRLPSFRLDCQSDRDLNLKKESSSSDSMPRDSGLGFSNAAFMAGSFVQLSNTSSVSEGKPLATTSGRKTDGKSESKMKDSNLVSSDSISCKASLQHGSSESSLTLMKESNLQTVGFSFHPNLRTTVDTLKLYSYAVWFDSSRKKLAQMKRKSKPKQRSISPQPTTILSDVFKEAKSLSRRFSTPPRSRNKQDNNVLRNNSPSNDLSTLQQISFVKGLTKLRTKKETPWARYFDNGVVRVTAVETTEKWIVNLSELYFGARFACGAHSRLYHGMYKNQPVAVKLIRLPDDDDSGVMVARLEKQFTREATFLSHLCHRNVIKFFSFSLSLIAACWVLQKSPILFIITEYLSGGSLWALLRKLDRSPLPLDNLISIALDVARGMEYIHSQGVIHRDLKSGNILFDKNLCVKIADFGVACEEAYCDVLGDDAGTYRWMAPEMIKHKPYGRKVDVYSFGLLLWEMITGAIPYEEMTPVQAAFAVVNKVYYPLAMSVISSYILRPMLPFSLCACLLEHAFVEHNLPILEYFFWRYLDQLRQTHTHHIHKISTQNLLVDSKISQPTEPTDQDELCNPGIYYYANLKTCSLQNLRPIIPANCPVVLRMLTEQCWSTLPEKRPEFWQIVKVLEQFESDLAHGGTLEQLQF
ncbi:hypothetical protein IEQ34_018288 [Dendrobium chrysotoxum]|uniref:Protein kinase domain-containing protein n=1 Tax=Dendrobium chrysotoxum TaxID=161865 RepID=A0AAV7GE64_DENCH|nr:hypothetical protein IEQ34_018288 [Dendrobium chrysotoxum]